MTLHPAFVLAAAMALCPLAAQTFPTPPTPSGNPTTPTKRDLGKALFWDEQLSSTRTVACGTCHIFSAGGADPRAPGSLHPGPDAVFATADDVRGSPGVPQTDASGSYVAAAAFDIRPQVTPRLAPSVVNAAYLSQLFWDGRANANQFRDPITGQVVLADNAALETLVAQPPLNTIEMGHLGQNWNDVASRIAAARPLALADQLPAGLAAFVAGRTYPQLFQQAFGTPGVTPSRIVMAIAAYLRTLIADQSPVDQFQLTGAPLSLPAQRGFGVFLRGCITCHASIQLVIGGPGIVDFRNTGVRPIAEDLGRFQVTNVATDRGAFKVPELRNVALRPRFFHNGGAATLGDVVDFYNRGGDFHVGQDPEVPALAGTIPAADRADLIVFLQALTDPRVQNETFPFDRPRLYSESTRVPTVFGSPSGAVVPRVLSIEPPAIGNPSLTFGLGDVPPGSFGFLGWDAAGHTAGVPLGGLVVHLGLSTMLHFVAAPQAAVPGPSGSGSLSLSFAVPDDVAMRGQQAFGQWLVLTPTSAAAASAGFRLTVF